MPRAPIEKRRSHYDNGEHLPHRGHWWEQNRVSVSTPKGKHQRRGEIQIEGRRKS